jgi:general secretion pathway protein N
MAVIRVMRLWTLLAISPALAATAAAGPIDGRAGLAPQVGAPNRSAPDSNATSRAGNPLWTIPLSALTATRDRPLFSASRRPPVAVVPIVAPPPQKREAPSPPPPERPSLTLMGTIVSSEASVALLQTSNADAFSRLRVGDQNGGWRVQGIDLRSIIVEKGAESVRLGLPKPDGSPVE